MSTQTKPRVVFCTDCGSIHPVDAACKPWTGDTGEQVPDAHIMDVIESYPIDFDEFERMVPA